MSTKQTKNGKAFEYACVKAIYNKYKGFQDVRIVANASMEIVKECYESLGDKQKDLDDAAEAAVRAIDKLEPTLGHSDCASPLLLSVQNDSAGISGDVRDVLCTRDKSGKEIGISCKHNHHAVKHSRLSDNIDFGTEWLGYPCSDAYFEAIRPIFQKLRELKESSKAAGKPMLWDEIDNKFEEFYVPVLQAFMDELKRLNSQYDDVPAKMLSYLIGRNDFYKVIADDAHRATRIEGINIAGSLSEPARSHKPITKIPTLKMPTTFYHIDFKEDRGAKSQTTISVVCDNGWDFTMRIHNASSKVEPSLKFDIQLGGYPNSIFAQVEPWIEK